MQCAFKPASVYCCEISETNSKFIVISFSTLSFTILSKQSIMIFLVFLSVETYEKGWLLLAEMQNVLRLLIPAPSPLFFYWIIHQTRVSMGGQPPIPHYIFFSSQKMVYLFYVPSAFILWNPREHLHSGAEPKTVCRRSAACLAYLLRTFFTHIILLKRKM